MPEYTLRNVDPQLWSRFTERANREGWTLRALFVNLMEGYASGEVSPSDSPPTELPEFAWLRAYYRQLAVKEPDLLQLSVDHQWDRLIDVIVETPAGLSWQTLRKIPDERRRQILDWLRRTSDVSVRHGLTLRAIASIGTGQDMRTNRRVFQYEVLGLPPRQQAWIADFNGGWRILRVTDGQQGHWGGPHLTKEDALDTLAQQIDQPDNTISGPDQGR